MKKLCLLILMTTVLCLTACGIERDNETSEITDRATEIETLIFLITNTHLLNLLLMKKKPIPMLL